MTDYAVTAISPMLIMAMVGSLVFFLIEVLYDGRYSDRLVWTMFFFVVGTVLIARIMILHGANRALIYAAGLAAATFLALQAFVDYPNLTMRSFSALINAGLMALVWWSANKLTWDCTHIDEDRRNAGRGVLDAAGLEASEKDDDEETDDKKLKEDATWLEKFLHHRKLQNQKPHTPGVWVLYFSLAALPLFGLGQSLIPPSDEARRKAAFNMIVVYVGSGLGLLATTTLLGLRKYLRDRGANIPVKMTAGWLGLAAGIVVVFLLIAAFLPRPHSETPLVNLPKWGSKERNASKNAKVKDKSRGKGEGEAGDTQKDKDAQNKQDGKSGSGEKKDGETSKGNDQSDQKGNEEKKDENRSSRGSRKETEKSSSEEKDDQKSESKQDSKTESPSNQKLGSVLETASSFLKWLAWIIIALIVIAAIVIFFLRYLAPFTSWAKNLLDWLSSLFRRKERKEHKEKTEEEKQQAPRPPPFETFRNPEDGDMNVEEMVTYSFAALESWAWERDLARRGQETPIEFARRVERENGFDAQRLATLYSQIAYSDAGTPGGATKTVREFWSSISNSVRHQ